MTTPKHTDYDNLDRFPVCEICGDPIVPGEGREPSKEGPKHTSCGSISKPDSFIGRLEPMDEFEVKINGKWRTASVEGARTRGREYIVKAVSRAGILPHGTDLFNLVQTTVSETEWSNTEAFGVVLEHDAMEDAEDNWFRYDLEPYGEVELRNRESDE